MKALEQLLLSCMVETQRMIEQRLEKVFIIEDIHKIERLLDKKLTNFYLLYEHNIETLLTYSDHLSKEQYRTMVRHNLYF